MGETALSSAVEAVSGRRQFIWEFIGWQIKPAAPIIPRLQQVYMLFIQKGLPEFDLTLTG
jgi:hypothetical protein